MDIQRFRSNGAPRWIFPRCAFVLFSLYICGLCEGDNDAPKLGSRISWNIFFDGEGGDANEALQDIPRGQHVAQIILMRVQVEKEIKRLKAEEIPLEGRSRD